MEPIISPLAIYVIGIIDNIIFVLGIFGFFFVVGSVVYILGCCFARVDGEPSIEEWKTGWGKIPYVLIPAAILFVLVAVFLPPSNTCIGMYAAKMVTHDVVSEAIKSGKAIKDEIKKDCIDVLEAIIDKEE